MSSQSIHDEADDISTNIRNCNFAEMLANSNEMRPIFSQPSLPQFPLLHGKQKYKKKFLSHSSNNVNFQTKH